MKHTLVFRGLMFVLAYSLFQTPYCFADTVIEKYLEEAENVSKGEAVIEYLKHNTFTGITDLIDDIAANIYIKKNSPADAAVENKADKVIDSRINRLDQLAKKHRVTNQIRVETYVSINTLASLESEEKAKIKKLYNSYCDELHDISILWKKTSVSAVIKSAEDDLRKAKNKLENMERNASVKKYLEENGKSKSDTYDSSTAATFAYLYVKTYIKEQLEDYMKKREGAVRADQRRMESAARAASRAAENNARAVNAKRAAGQ